MKRSGRKKETRASRKPWGREKAIREYLDREHPGILEKAEEHAKKTTDPIQKWVRYFIFYSFASPFYKKKWNSPAGLSLKMKEVAASLPDALYPPDAIEWAVKERLDDHVMGTSVKGHTPHSFAVLATAKALGVRPQSVLDAIKHWPRGMRLIGRRVKRLSPELRAEGIQVLSEAYRKFSEDFGKRGMLVRNIKKLLDALESVDTK